MLKISRDSWHYKLYRFNVGYVHGWFDAEHHMPKTICKYFWGSVARMIELVTNFMFRLFARTVGCTITSTEPMKTNPWMFLFGTLTYFILCGMGFNVIEDDGSFLKLILFFGFLLFGFVFSITLGVSILESIRLIMKKTIGATPTPAKAMSFFKVIKETIKAKKTKICPFIEYVD